MIAEEKALESVWQKKPVIAMFKNIVAKIRRHLISLERPLSYTVNS